MQAVLRRFASVARFGTAAYAGLHLCTEACIEWVIAPPFPARQVWCKHAFTIICSEVKLATRRSFIKLPGVLRHDPVSFYIVVQFTSCATNNDDLQSAGRF